MALKDRINDDLKAALLSGNHFTSMVLRGLKATILNEEVAQKKRDEGLDDPIIEQIIAREVKKRHESANIYEGASRPELAVDERAEAEILVTYLPEQLSESQINEVVTRTISKMGVTSISGMGQVIGAVKKELGNTADGALISKLVRGLLN